MSTVIAEKEIISQTSENSPPVVNLQDVAISFGDKELLQAVNLQVKEGERIAILGPGGCGKSTLLKIMLGIIEPSKGKVEILGSEINNISQKERSKILRKIGMAFQQGALFDFMTVRENVLFAMENMTSFNPLQMEEKVARMLKEVNLPAAAGKIPSELSGGMRRRVGIVRALATNPRLVLLDEPTAGLDPVTSTIVIDMIHKLAAQEQNTMVCVTSSVEVAFTFSKKVGILKEGKIIGPTTWEELHASEDPWILHFLDVRGFVPHKNDI